MPTISYTRLKLLPPPGHCCPASPCFYYLINDYKWSSYPSTWAHHHPQVQTQEEGSYQDGAPRAEEAES